MTKNLILALLAAAAAASCGRSQPASEEAAFYAVYYDILVARERYAVKEQGDSAVASILARYNMTEAELRARFSELAADPERFRRTIDSLRNRASEEVRKAQTGQ